MVKKVLWMLKTLRKKCGLWKIRHAALCHPCAWHKIHFLFSIFFERQRFWLTILRYINVIIHSSYHSNRYHYNSYYYASLCLSSIINIKHVFRHDNTMHNVKQCKITLCPLYTGRYQLIPYPPMKTRPSLCSNSGSLGFSEAWPQPAQTAWKTKHRASKLALPTGMAFLSSWVTLA